MCLKFGYNNIFNICDKYSYQDIFMYYVNALITAKTFVLYCKRLSVSLFSVCKDKKLYNTKQAFIEKSFKN